MVGVPLAQLTPLARGSGIGGSMSKPVSSLSEYVQSVHVILESWGRWDTTTLPWFRGHSSAAWSLTPSLYRSGINPKYERELVRDFRLRATAYLERVPLDYLGWLFVMQHYGIPTRLIDWSESYLIGIYFAVMELANEDDGAVWILDPWSLNTPYLKAKTVPISRHPCMNDYILDIDGAAIVREVKSPDPLAVRPDRSTPRIVSQRGMFTIHGRSNAGIEKVAASRKTSQSGELKLERIIVNGKSKKEMYRELYLAGISQSVLFPELSGLASEIRMRYSDLFVR
jgi:FRG domain